MITVRKAILSDAHLIYDIYEKDGDLADFPNVMVDLEEELSRIDTRVVWIALDGDQPVGTVALVLDNWQKDLADGETIAMVKRLRVREDYRGRGVSRMLNDALEDEARKLGFQRLSIEVSGSNIHAKNIYEHWGYKFFRIGYRIDELALTKPL